VARLAVGHGLITAMPLPSWLRPRRSTAPPPAPTSPRVQAAFDAARAGDLDGAEHALRAALAANPGEAAAWMGLGNVMLARGRPSDALDPLRKALALDPGFAPARMNAVQCLRALGRHDAAVDECHVLLAQDPAGPAAALLARTLGDAGRVEEATAAYESALDLSPEDAGLWCDYGELLRGAKREANAERALRRALALDASHPGTLNNLGLLLYEADRLVEAEALLLRAAAPADAPPQALANLANLRVAQNRVDEAIALSDRALAAGLDAPEVHFSRAMTLLVAGRMAEGFAEYEHRFGTRLYAGMARQGPGLPWQGEPLEGGRILLWPEQGLGDTLQFARYARLLAARGAQVIIEAQPPLVRLLAASLPARVVAPGTAVEADFHCPMLSLPHRLGTVPPQPQWDGAYLQAPPDGAAAAALAALPRPRVGLVWAGNPSHLNDANRSLPFEALAPLLAVPDVHFCALQFGPAAADASRRAAATAWTDLAPLIADFADTAAALASLDLLVTVDTSVAHLAGALGLPAWVMLPFSPDWRWQLEREDTPWYPSLRLLRQRTPRDWAPVVRDAATRLSNLSRA
jgi:Flp pilus assembly protein TadD